MSLYLAVCAAVMIYIEILYHVITVSYTYCYLVIVIVYVMIVLACGIWVGSVLLLVSTGTVASAHVIHVKDSGNDSLDCLKGITPCWSLEYVFNNTAVQANEPWTVFVEESQNFTVSWMNLHNASISIGPLLESSDSRPVRIDFNELFMTAFQNLSFHKLSVFNLPSMLDGLTVKFHDCFVETGLKITNKMVFSDINTIIFTNCTFMYDCEDVNSDRPSNWLKFGHTIDVVTFINCILIGGSHTPFIYFSTIDNKIYTSQGPYVTFNGCHFHRVCLTYVSVFEDDGSDGTSLWIDYNVYSRLTINNCNFSNSQNFDVIKSLISTAGSHLIITNTLFSHNQLSLNNVFAALLTFKDIKGSWNNKLINVTFVSNTGAAISAGLGGLLLSNVSFINNTGKHSGGIILKSVDPSLFGVTSLLFKGPILFKDNRYTDGYGGVIFIQNPCNGRIRFGIDKSHMHFEDETQYIFYLRVKGCLHYIKYNGNFTNNIRTVAYKFQIAKHPHINVFPGQHIVLRSVNITDYYGHESHCTATPTYTAPLLLASCNESTCVKSGAALARNQVVLKGETLIFIHSTDSIQTSLYFTSEHEHTLPLHNMVIKITCSTVETYVTVSLIPCPLGYRFISNGSLPNIGTCEKAASNDTNLVYNTIQGVVCIRHNYWYGKMNKHNITAPCSLPYCAVGVPCPITGYTETHYRLPQTQDEQCNGHYGGALCRSCKSNAVFTFGASNCLLKSKCHSNWQPYALPATAIGVQMFITIVMIFLRPATKFGVGYLYGPLFFLSVYKTLPISHTLVQGGSHLDIVLSLYQSILLLDLDILSKMPWCFFEDIDQTLVYSLRFLGPLVTFVTITLIVLIARMRCFFKKFNTVFPSPIQPMCLLLILSFWSLSNTSIEILKPVVIAGEWRFSIEPEHKYLGNPYIIVLQCIAIMLLTLVYVPFILLLCLSQFIRKKINLFRIQPFLDAFQSTFRNSYHWYSGVYLLSWLILSINMPLYYLVIIFSGIVLLYFFIQPHKRRFMNVCDVLLLMDMMILISISFLCTDNYNCTRPAVIINYPFIILPLLYMLIGGVWLILKERLYKCKSRISQIVSSRCSLTFAAAKETIGRLNNVAAALDHRENEDIRSKMKCVPVTEVIMEREPLIYDD